MKKILCTVLALCLFYFNTGIAFAVTKTAVVSTSSATEEHRGLTVPVSFESTVNSDRLYPGDILPITVMDDVYIDNKKMFAKDTRGTAEIELAKRSGGHGRAGA